MKGLEEANVRPEISKREIELSILMLGNDIYFSPNGKSSKRRFDSRELVQLPNPPGSRELPSVGYVRTISISMGSPNQPDSCINIKLMPGLGHVEYSNSFEDVAEFQLFGRFRELPGSWGSEIFRNKVNRENFSFSSDALTCFLSEVESKGLQCEVVGEEIYDETKKAKVVEVRKNGVLSEKYLIDPSRGHICPYLFAVDESGTFSTECFAENFSTQPGADLYYLSLFTMVVNHPAIGETRSIYQLMPETFVLNQAVSEKEFAIDVPEGARVYSRIMNTSHPPTTDQSVEVHETLYHAIRPGVISLVPGGYDLPNLSWLVREEALEDYVPPRGGARGGVRWLLGGIGILLIIIALYQKWKHRQPAYPLFSFRFF